MKYFAWLLLLALVTSGCSTKQQSAGSAGDDVYAAMRVTPESVLSGLHQESLRRDSNSTLASPGSEFSQRLERVTAPHRSANGMDFNYAVYINPALSYISAADGSIRVHSGLMSLMTDDELRFFVASAICSAIDSRQSLQTLNTPKRGDATAQGATGRDSSIAHKTYQLDHEALGFMKKYGYDTGAAVIALYKLAKNDHRNVDYPSYADRAARLSQQIAGR